MRGAISRSMRIALGGLGATLLFVRFAGAGDSAEEPPPPPGKLVDIGGYRLHIWCMGKESESPAVVLIPGAGDFSFTWGLVQPEVARFTRVCSYDGAGEAWSDKGPVPRTIKQQAYEMHLSLREAGVKGPYVLVGASGGGILARVYAREYRSEVVGMVLVDSTDPDTVVGKRINGKNVDVRVREESKGRPVPPVQTMKSSPPGPLSAEGLERWESYLKSMGEPRIFEPHNLLPPDLQKLDTWARFYQPRARLEAAKRERATVATPKTLNANLGSDFEPEEFQELYEQAQREAHPLGDMPLIVLIAGDKSRTVGEQETRATDPRRKVFQEKRYQKIAQALLSRNGKYVVVESEHEIHLYQPAWVVEAIRLVVEAARKQARLAREELDSLLRGPRSRPNGTLTGSARSREESWHNGSLRRMGEYSLCMLGSHRRAVDAGRTGLPWDLPGDHASGRGEDGGQGVERGCRTVARTHFPESRPGNDLGPSGRSTVQRKELSRGDPCLRERDRARLGNSREFGIQHRLLLRSAREERTRVELAREGVRHGIPIPGACPDG